MTSEPTSDLIRHCAQRLSRQPNDVPSLEAQATATVRSRVAALVERVRGTKPTGPPVDLAPYLARAWQCIAHHLEKFLESDSMSFKCILDRLEAGELAYGQVGVNVLEEVVLAQSLELGEQGAARKFDADYMPGVRKVAQKIGGQRAVDAVDNFAAELVLPRAGRSSRLSTFLGRTPLGTWLRTVVVNYWLTQTRREKYERPAETPEVIHRETPDHLVDGRPCRELLTPVFQQAARAIGAEDRLLLKLLLLDGVPQKDVARAMKLNSGTITRRRQKGAEQVLLEVRAQVSKSGHQQQTHRCLELALTGDSPELRSGLAEMLAIAIGGATEQRLTEEGLS